jgi:PAS domain S-box-containing protein
MSSLHLSLSILTLIENHLLLFSMGHVGIVVLLLALFLKKSHEPKPLGDKPKDEDTFDYETEQGSLFKHHSTDAGPEESPSLPPMADRKQGPSPQAPGLMQSEDKITFVEDSEPGNSIPEETPESETIIEDGMIGVQTEDTDTPPPPSLQERRKERIREVFNGIGTIPVIAIGRDETIFDLNDQAREMLGFDTEDIEGRRIDEVIFLEDSGESTESKEDAQQSARAQCKDGSLFPLQVELEMADREFGVITVTLLPKREPDQVPVAAVSGSSDLETITETDGDSDELNLPSKEETTSTLTTELPIVPPPPPFPPPAAAPLAFSGPAINQPLPPPPRKRPLPPLSPSQNALAIAGQGLDSKTVEMFASNLSQPLQSIAQLAALIVADEQSIPHLKKYAVAIQAKSNRILSQIEEMSVLVSAQKGDIQRKDRPFNLSRTLGSLVELASSVVNSQQQRIHFKRDEQDLIVLSDEGLFEKVISNLINLALQSAEHRDVTLTLESNMITVLGDQETSISFNGEQLQIDGTREVIIRVDFPSDPNTNRFFDIAIHRTDTSLINKLQASNALKNLTTTIRLMKELAHGLGGQFSFRADQPELGVINLKLRLSSAEVAAYPSE